MLIGTANRAQGLERDVVVVIHPLAGYREAAPFATDAGRLCVALSRHRAYATIVVDNNSDLFSAMRRKRPRATPTSPSSASSLRVCCRPAEHQPANTKLSE